MDSNESTVQVGGIIFEALRLVMVQRLLSSAEFKMDPLVSLYYYAPACAVTNGVVTLFTELPRMTMADIYGLGMGTLIANAMVAFLLNVSVVLLVSTPSLVGYQATVLMIVDWQNLRCGAHHGRDPQGYSPCFRVHGYLPRSRYLPAVCGLLDRPGRIGVLQAWS